MSKFGPFHVFLIVGGRNLSADHFTLDDTVEQVTEQTNGFAVQWEEHKPIGLAKILLEAGGGLYDTRVGGIMEAFQGLGTTRQVVSYGFEGTGLGANVILLDGDYAVTWKRMAQREGLTKAHAVHRINAQYLQGKVVHGLTAEVSDPGNSQLTPLDNAASSANGASLDLQVTALTLGGFTNVVITPLHSADNVTYVTLGSAFTARTAVGAQRKDVTGTVERYVAIGWDFTGAGAGQSVTPYVSIARNA